MAPLALELSALSQLRHSIVVSGQHRALLDDVLELFQLVPAADLNIMRPGQSLEHVTSEVLGGLSGVFDRLRPDFVLVHGDTTTTFAAALAAFYCRIPIGHVEAGLRTNSIAEPFPEEFNRRAADLLATHHYCPTARALACVRNNPDCGGSAWLTGNTVLDAVRLCYRHDYQFVDAQLADFAAYPGPKLLVTAHRRENWGERMSSICQGITLSLRQFPDALVCFCCHPNPQVRETVTALLGDHSQVMLIEPPRFDVFVNLLAASDLVLSDSGGIQEEVTQLGRFVLVLREETERPEAVEAGFARVVGTAASSIDEAVADCLPRCLSGELPLRLAGDLAASPFGDGYAARAITSRLLEHFGLATQGSRGNI
jgi:UDP-N-acetylglucosamine 2-epimerase (non-hydrolysing)